MTSDSNLEILRDAPEETHRLSDTDFRNLIAEADQAALLRAAAGVRDLGHGRIVTYSRKVFIPLTHLCRDVCHYCTFARPPRRGEAAFMTPEQVLEIAQAGEGAGCHEALFTLGDKPELRYRAARDALDALGYESTIAYLADMCALVLRETSLLPHVNPGVMTTEEIAALRRVSVSQGIMLESASERLGKRGGPHYGSPDKDPKVRLETMRLAGAQSVPFTSGILIGIGETPAERIDALLALRALHTEYGHVQELIIQNFRAKPGTRMHDAPEPEFDALMWTIAVARLAFGPDANIQAPPNLSAVDYPALLAAGLNDWGGVSPVTPDHVNPEAPWPHLTTLKQRTEDAGHRLVERLAVYPAYCADLARWVDSDLVPRVLQYQDARGFARTDSWSPGIVADPPASDIPTAANLTRVDPKVSRLIDKAGQGDGLDEGQILTLFDARGTDYHAVCRGADELRRSVNGDTVKYVVNRNINYTNICYFKCQFCAFSKGKLSENLRGTPYDLAVEEVLRRAHEAWDRGATEVCMQGGIHPAYTGDTYLQLCRALKAELPDLHIHAFSPLEVWQGAETLGVPVAAFLARLREAGLGTLPGTAAEILDDDVRAILCPDKIRTNDWLSVMRSAHEIGLRSTSTIMFGHMEGADSWARHLVRIRDLQLETGGFTEFVPLPFVHMEAPIYLKGRARKGPTFRETVLMHAVARLALHPHITNIQVSWVKLGRTGAAACLEAGANDLGGTLMNESISRAAGTAHGQEMPPEAMDAFISSMRRLPRQRTTLYQEVPERRQRESYGAPPLEPISLTPVRKRRTAKTPVNTAASS